VFREKQVRSERGSAWSFPSFPPFFPVFQERERGRKREGGRERERRESERGERFGTMQLAQIL